jgi:zinc protease
MSDITNRQSSLQSANPSSPAEKSAGEGELFSRRLACGLEVRIMANAGQGPQSDEATVACQLWIRAGSADELADEHGCAHLLEHMLFKPLSPRSEGTNTAATVDATFDLGARLAALGGDANAYTSLDETVFHFHGPRRHTIESLDLLFSSIFREEIDGEELQRERLVVLEEIKLYDDDTLARSTQAVIKGLYGDHAYGRPVLGLAKEVVGHSKETLDGFHRRYYHPANAVLTIVGAVEIEPLVAAIESLVARFRVGQLNSRPHSQPTPLEAAIVHVERADASEASLRFAWQAPPNGSLEAIALDVVASCLGNGDASRLVEVLRRREQVVAEIHASLYPGIFGSIFMVSAQCTGASLVDATHRIFAEIERLSRVEFGVREIEAAKKQLSAGLIYRRETVQGLAHALGWALAVGGSDDYEARYFEMLDRVTPRLACEVATKFLKSRLVSYYALVPEKQVSAATAKALVSAVRHTPKNKTSSAKIRELPGHWGLLEASLGCGLRILLRPDTSLPMVSAFLTWPGGGRLESAKQAGVAALTATLLARGSMRQSGQEVARTVESAAASFSGFCGRQSLGMNFECLSSDAQNVLTIMLESAVAPRFDPHEFDEERRVMLQDLIADEDDLGFVANRALSLGMYGSHPYGRDRRGDRESLNAIDRNQLARLFAKNYPIGRASMAMAGDVDPARVVSLVCDVLADLGVDPHQRTEDKPFSWPGKAPSWPRRSTWHKVSRRRDQAHLCLGFPGLKIGDPRGASLDLILQILSGSNGRLFFRLREELGLVYSVGAGASEGIDAGHVVIAAASEQDRIAQTHREIIDVLQRFATEGPSDSELEVARAALEGQIQSSLQRRGKVALNLSLAAALKVPETYFLDVSQRLAATQKSDVLTLARDLFLKQVPTYGLVHDPRRSKL